MADGIWVPPYDRGDGTPVSGHVRKVRRVHRSPRQRMAVDRRGVAGAAAQMAEGDAEGQWVAVGADSDLFVGPNGDYSGISLRDVNLDGLNVWNSSLHFANMEGVSLRGALLGSGDLRGMNVRVCDMEGACLRGSDAFGSIFYETSLRDVDATGVLFDRAVFSECDLRGVDWRDADVSQITVACERVTSEFPYHQFSFREAAYVLGLDVEEVAVLAWSGALEFRDNESLAVVDELVDEERHHLPPWALQNFRRG